MVKLVMDKLLYKNSLWQQLIRKDGVNNILRNSRNITELKINLMDSNLYFSKEEKMLFLSDEEDIITSLVSCGAKLAPDDSKGAIYKSNQNKKFDSLHFRLLDLKDDWIPAGNWMIFFIELGRYIASKKEIHLFINYIDAVIPAVLIGIGAMDHEFSKLKLTDFQFEMNPGDEILVLDNKNWHKAEVIEILDDYGREEFRPYLKVFVKPKGEARVEKLLPKTMWANNIKFGGKAKNARGRSKKVHFNDRISEVLSKRYSEEVTNRLRSNPQVKLNYIGRNIDTELRNILKSVQIGDCKGIFLPSDYLYFSNNNESYYINTNIIRSITEEVQILKDSISIFIGSKSGLSFNKFNAHKNIYLTTYDKKVNYENALNVEENLMSSSKLSIKEKLAKTAEVFDYIESKNIEIPTGVELLVY